MKETKRNVEELEEERVRQFFNQYKELKAYIELNNTTCEQFVVACKVFKVMLWADNEYEYKVVKELIEQMLMN